MFDPNRPHNELPILPPGLEIETKPVLKRCVAARTALAELRLAGQLIPDQSVLINSIPILEARASSEIENIVTTNDALFRAASLFDDAVEPANKEALRYRTALSQGFGSLASRPLTFRTAIDVCRTIKGTDIEIRRLPGTALRNSLTGEAIYTPPEGEPLIRDLLTNWERTLNEPGDLDPLVRMAMLHYQFEAIYPFPDGNGRTGRVLNLLLLVQDRLLELPTLYLSRYILAHRPDYYRLLLRVTSHGEWEPWIAYMLDAVESTATWTNAKIRAIRGAMDATARHVQQRAPKIYSRELIDLLFGLPYCRIANVVERGIAKRQAAATYLHALVEIGVVEQMKAGREKLFVNRRYLDLLAAEEHAFKPFEVPS